MLQYFFNFIYISLYTEQIVSKQFHNIKQENNRINNDATNMRPVQ